MMLDKLKKLASELNLANITVRAENVIFAIQGKGDLKNNFPIPDCENCTEKCCPAGVAISLFDVARFIDLGLDNYIAGKFEGYVELFLSDDSGSNVKLSRPYMSSETKLCVFQNEERKCSIYENRPFICRAFPIAIRIDDDRNHLAIWMGGCQNYKITSNKEAFQQLLDSAIQDYNEKVTANSLLMYSRNALRENGFGKYMEDEWKILIDYNKKNKELDRQVKDLQQVVERLRMPQDINSILERMQSENEWLKERLVHLENEMKQQSERAHSIITDLTKQISSEYRKLIETLIQSEKEKTRGFWKR